jgi:hypothetical protein
MWWSINTVYPGRRLRPVALPLVLLLLATGTAISAAGQSDLRVPEIVTAGTATSILAPGNGGATLYLAGPDHTVKRAVNLGQEIPLRVDELQTAGRYVAVVCSQSCSSAAFFVVPSVVSSLSFLVHPSRVPVGERDAISGVALPFDKFHNLVLAPVAMNFGLTLGNANLMSRSMASQGGVAWFRADSGSHAGTLQLLASTKDISARRVVQQVAADPCNIRIEAQRTAKGIAIETQPMRDCTGNPVQDGTVVSFTATGEQGKSTVDAPAKQGIARAQMTIPGRVVISAASGVVMGNEVRMGGQP